MTIDRPRSREVTEGAAQAPSRSYLRAVGFSDDDFDKAQVAVASSWNEVTPCNYHLDKLAALAKEGVRQAGCVPLEFTTIAVSDGIAMGHEGMKASLMSRDLIADSVELMMHAERMDALVGIAGCDKSEPGMLMAMARLDLPSVYLYGGTILPGTYRGRDITIQDVFEAVGAHAKGQVSDAELLELERAACPTAGSCAGMYTANTMAAVGEALGMSLPGSASPPAVDYRREVAARESGIAVAHLLELDLRPRQIMTREAFENAIAVTMALAGSTNAVLHLLAIAREAHVELESTTSTRPAGACPTWWTQAPGGPIRDERPDRVGGVPVVMMELLGVLHGSC
jgi:dihydroxy-acid dehydratase